VLGHRATLAIRHTICQVPDGESARDNPEEVRRIVPTYTETSPEAVQQMRLPVFDRELDREGIELEADLTAKYGIIEEAPASEDLVRE
jgi:NitT/TauT family transport system substrate-binding protein